MNAILRGYYVNEPTWFYLSFLLIIAVFFRFGRLWSLRNLDLALLLSVAPALLFAQQAPHVGYVWVFLVTGLLLVRVLCDASFTRRPRLPVNMNAAGLTFLCAAAFAFLMTKVMTEPPSASAVEQIRQARQLLAGQDTTRNSEGLSEAGPGSRLFAALVAGPSTALIPAPSDEQRASLSELVAARAMAILAHLAVIIGLVLLAHWHFGDIQLGLSMATLYLLLPCTAYDVGKVNHVLPAALVVWAFVTYRNVWLSGCLLGLACGSLFFPIFLLPLWGAFYGRQGALRFSLALSLITCVLVGSLVLTSADTHSFTRQTLGIIDWQVLQFREIESAGFWAIYPAAYRIPVFVSFLILLTVLTIWPRRKNLGDLMANSAAVVIATQFWYPEQGGVYVLWYLPLLLMVVFRPQLNQQFAPEVRPLRLFRRAAPAPPPQLVASSASTPQLFR